MTTFELNERLVEMPTDWKEITLEKYVEIARLDDLRRNTTIQELYILKLIEVLCDLRDNEGDDLENICYVDSALIISQSKTRCN